MNIGRARGAIARQSAGPAGIEIVRDENTGRASAGHTKWWEAARARLSAQFDPVESQAVRRNALSVFAIRVVSAALLFVSQIILARWIGADSYGLYVALWSAVLVTGGLSHLGLSTAMMRLVPQYRASNDFDHLRGILIGGRFIAIAGGLTTAAAGALLLWLTGAAQPSQSYWAMAMALACLPAYALTEAQDGLGRGQGWTLESIAPPYIFRPAIILLGAACAASLSLPPTAVTAMACALAATWATAIVQSYLIHRRLNESVPAGKAAFAFPLWLKVSLPLLAVSGSELVLQNADVLLLNVLRPPAEVGIYYAAAKTTCLALFVHYAVGSAYSGRFATAGALGDRDGLARLTREAVTWTFWPSVAVTIVVLTCGPFLLGLFGRDFEGAYPAMFILSAGLLARAATGPSEFVLNMLGRQNDCARSFATAAGVSIALNLILIPHFGAFGAATATACGFATASALNWRTARRELGLNLFVFARSPDAGTDVKNLFHALRTGLQSSGFFGSEFHKSADLLDAVALSIPATSDADLVVYDVVRNEAGFKALEADWKRLYQSAGATSQPFMTFAWHKNWLKHYHAGQSHPLGVQLAVVVGRQCGRAVVIWPLLTKRMAGMTYMYWMGQPVSQYGDVLVDRSADVARIVKDSWSVVLNRLKPDVVILRKVRADAAVASLLKAEGAIATLTEKAPFVETRGHDSYVNFEMRYSAKARKNRRRLMRRLEEKGSVEFVHLKAGPEAAALVSRAIDMKRNWLSAKGLLSAALYDRRFETFFSAVAIDSCGAGSCLVSALKLDGQPAAIMVSIVGEQHLAGHIFAHDLALDKYGVGVLLLEECLRHAVSERLKAFDLLAPGDAYKFDWCDQHVEVADWALATSARGHILTRLHLPHAREQVKQTAKRLPSPVRRLLRRVLLRSSLALRDAPENNTTDARID